MHKDISPEEKLLSIIRTRQNTPESAAQKPDIKDIKSAPRSPWSKIDDYILAALKNDFLKNSIFSAPALSVFSKYAVVAAALIAVYLILDIIFVSPSRKATKLFAKVSVSRPSAQPEAKMMPIETKSYSYYSNRMSGRNIFAGGSYIQSESQVAGADSSAELSGGSLGLVGIIPGDNPQAIVEEKKNQKTYYLIKGQSINGITIEDIYEDKVTLEYRGKNMTLSL